MKKDDEAKFVKPQEMAPEKAPDLGLEKEAPIEAVEAQPEVEQVSEQVEQEKPQEAPEVSVPKAAPVEPAQAPIRKDELLVDVENILADDLGEVFAELPDDKKLAFKQKGEEVAVKIREAVEGGKVKIGKMLGWIREWLKMIPGVSKYYIDQEAKIKADKILKYAEAQKERIKNKV